MHFFQRSIGEIFSKKAVLCKKGVSGVLGKSDVRELKHGNFPSLKRVNALGKKGYLRIRMAKWPLTPILTKTMGFGRPWKFSAKGEDLYRSRTQYLLITCEAPPTNDFTTAIDGVVSYTIPPGLLKTESPPGSVKEAITQNIYLLPRGMAGFDFSEWCMM
ncbi:hypothetical protein ACFE04_000066 [Oxalis oulophora]